MENQITVNKWKNNVWCPILNNTILKDEDNAILPVFHLLANNFSEMELAKKNRRDNWTVFCFPWIPVSKF
jgi:hypothetical protein